MSDRDKGRKEVMQRWFASARAEGKIDLVLQRRCAKRAGTEAPITVYDHHGDAIACELRDVSELGLGIRSRKRMLELTGVRVQLLDEPDEYVCGLVIHCTPDADGFDIGLRVVAEGSKSDELIGFRE